MRNQSTNEASQLDERSQLARERRQGDEQLLEQAATGDALAYRRLVDEWTAGAFDRALHRGADERSAADAVITTFTTLQTDLRADRTSFGSRVMGSIEQLVPARPRALGKATRGARRAGERLTRGTDAAALGADPSISAMCWDALDVLGDKARDVTDLHYRHGLEPDEIAAATGESVLRVEDILRKAPAGLGAALRTRLLWSGGKPDHDELLKDLKANNVRTFDSTAVRVIHTHLRGCAVCRSRSLIAIPAIEVFAHIPLVAVPGELGRRIESASWAPAPDRTTDTGALLVAAAAATTAPDEVPSGVPDEEPTAADAAAETTALEPAAVEAGALGAGPVDEDAHRPAPSAPEEVAARSGDAAPAGAARAGTAATAAAAAAYLATRARAAEGSVDTGASPLTDAAPTDAAPLGTVSLTGLGSSPAAATPAAGLDTTEAPTTTAPSSSLGAGPAHAPVSGRAGHEDRPRPKWLIPAVVGAAAVILIGLVAVFTGGGGDDTSVDAVASGESTTTTSRAPSSTTAPTTAPSTTASTAPPTTSAPSTSAPPSTPPSTSVGGGNAPVTTTTRPAAVVANVFYSMTPGTIRLDDSGGSAFSWNVTANGPVTVSVTGPGLSSGSLSGDATVCAPAGSCGLGTHYFSIVAKDADGRQVGAGTAKLIIRD